MIMELLLDDRSGKFILPPLRLVSKQFNALVTPLLYRYVDLRIRHLMLLVSTSANLAPHEARLVRNMREYTQDVNLTADLDKTTYQMENTVSRT